MEQHDPPKGTVPIFADVAGETEAEQTPESHEGNFRSFFEHVDDIILVGTPDGRVLYANPAASRKLGYMPDELQTMHILDLHPENVRKEAETIFAAMFRGERETCPLPVRTRSGDTVPVETRVWPGKWSGLDCIFGICKDLSKEQEALQKFDRFFHSNPCPMAVTTVLDRKFVDVNDAFLSTLGFSRDDIIGDTSTNLNIFANPEQQEEIARRLEREGRIESMELTVRRKDGTTVDGMFSGEVIESQGEKYFLTVMLDISERKRGERALRESELKFRTFSDFAHDWEYWVGPDDQLKQTSPSCERVTGYSSEEFMKNPKLLTTIVHPEDRLAFARHQCCTWGDPEEIDYRIVTRTGEERWIAHRCIAVFDGTGRWLGRRVTASDITDRVMLQKELLLYREHLEEMLSNRVAELHASELHFRDLFDYATDSIYLYDRDIDRFVDVNPQGCASLGYSRDEILKLSVTDIDPNYDRTRMETVFATLEPGVPIMFETTHRRKDGSIIQVEMKVGLFGEPGSSRIIGITRDITERLMAQRRQDALQMQLMQSQKMEAMGTLASGIAHDFNNIIFGIEGYTELALDEQPEGTSSRRYLDRVLEASKRAGEMVQQILLFSHQSLPEKQLLDLTPLVKEGLKFLRATIPSTIEIRPHIGMSLGMVEADPTQMHQVLMNLCTNAAYAMRDTKGVMTVELSAVTLDSERKAERLGLTPGRYLRLSVTDTGRGIPPDIVGRIFEPYFTTKAAGEGTGMGLSVIHGIVVSHGGTITVDSREGEGTTFQVFFPFKETATRHETPNVDQSSLRGHGRVLMVDDEEHVLDMQEAMLRKFGYEVVSMNNPLDALELVRSDPQRFDMVITDMTMPRMTGTELASEILALRPGIPIILCTGLLNDLPKVEAAKIGIDSVMRKPMSLKELARAVQKALNQ